MTPAMVSGPHAGLPPVVAGTALATATHALVLVHGRGGSAEGMLPIARAAKATGAALVAPQAAGQSWYPARFLAPVAQNEPWLSSALEQLAAAVEMVQSAGIPRERILLVGFSQGACLTLEYVAREAARAEAATSEAARAEGANAAVPLRFGGVAALAGALIGDATVPRHDHGSLAGTPVLLACGMADAHIPESHVRASADVFRTLGATVDLRLYPGVGHDITGDQIAALTEMVSTIA